jgi:hypothetical protein
VQSPAKAVVIASVVEKAENNDNPAKRKIQRIRKMTPKYEVLPLN